MRKIYLIAGMWAALLSAKAQQIATFEEIELQSDSYYNGSDGAGGFLSGGILFPNSYDNQWSYWSGFSVSNSKDTTTAGYENQYSAIAAGGADGSENFAVVYAPSDQKLPFDNPVKIEGFYVTNSVYAYLSMRNGDEITKKFGGADGTDSDYFRLMVSAKDASGNVADTIIFYLADFRSDIPDEDYIVDEWQWLDLSSLGVVSELTFWLESTDTGEWGLNTPAYFCIDNFTVSAITSRADLVNTENPNLKVFPNPVKDLFRVEVPEDSQEIVLTSGTGKIIWRQIIPGKGIYTMSALNNMPSGIYYLQLKTKIGTTSEKIIKF